VHGAPTSGRDGRPVGHGPADAPLQLIISDEAVRSRRKRRCHLPFLPGPPWLPGATLRCRTGCRGPSGAHTCKRSRKSRTGAPGHKAADELRWP
jgi:hypothetical protein